MDFQYKSSNFIADPTPTDVELKIYNKNRVLKYTLNPNRCVFYYKSYYIYITQGDKENIVLDFETEDDAAIATKILNEKKAKLAIYIVNASSSYTKTELNNGALDNRYYTQTYIENNYYTNSEINTIISGVTSGITIELQNYYTKSEVYNTGQTYNKNEVNSLLSGVTTTLSGLTDVELQNLLTGQTIIYNGNKWVNSSLTEAVYIGDSEVTVGGISNGDYFSGDTMEVMFYKLLHPYKSPVLSLSASPIFSTIEVGYVFTTGKTFSWTTTNPTNINNNGISLSGYNVNITGLTYSGSTYVNLSGLTYSSPTTSTWTSNGTNTKSVVFSSTVSVSWSYKRFYGTNSSTTLSNSDVLNLTSEFSSLRTKTWSQDGNGQYIYYCYSIDYGDNTPNPPFIVGGLPNSDWTRVTQTVTLSTGINKQYYIYRTNNIQYGTGISIQKL